LGNPDTGEIAPLEKTAVCLDSNIARAREIFDTHHEQNIMPLNAIEVQNDQQEAAELSRSGR